MDGWTIIMLPTLNDDDAMDRTWAIASWVTANKIDETTVAISSRIVRFKDEATATFFRIGFPG